jgi:uncharacterized membrane protein (UPF0127 family)
MKYLFVFSLVLFFSCNDKPQNPVKTTEVMFTKHGDLSIIKKETDSIIKVLDIEIADTPYKTETGLMYRNSMENNQGMLFVFEDMRPRSFYMKNTRFALDIIYINDKKEIVSFQKNAQPFNETSLPSGVPAKYVLEINAGLADAWGLSLGDKIDWQTP